MSDFYEVTFEKKGHYRIGSKESVFMDLFVGEEKSLLLDTGYGYGNLKEQVKKITDDPLIIVNSHGHLDHVCGNYQFEETVYIHEKDIELCRQHTGVEQRNRALKNAKNNRDFVTGIMNNILPEGFDEKAYISKGTGKLASIKEGQQFRLGGITLTVYEFPGHTPGSIGLLWEEEKTLFVGDAMNPLMWLFLPEALTLADYKETLYKAYTIDFTCYYMSHSPAGTKKETILDYIDIAEHLDYEKGVFCETPLAPGMPARICLRKGYGTQDIGKPGFASIVISEGHL